jgi:hypothetical protein
LPDVLHHVVEKRARCRPFSARRGAYVTRVSLRSPCAEFPRAAFARLAVVRTGGIRSGIRAQTGVRKATLSTPPVLAGGAQFRFFVAPLPQRPHRVHARF